MTFIYDALGVVFGPVMAVIYSVVNNYGIAIILFTIFCRLLMLPSAISQQKNLAKNQRMQYKMRKINERYKDDRQRLQQETQEFYRREGYNPMSAGCSGGMLLQMPIMFGLIAAIYRPLQYTLKIPMEVLNKLGENAAKILADDKLKPGLLNIQLRIAENIDKFQAMFGMGDGLIDPKWLEAIREFTEHFRLFGLDLGKTPSEGKWYYYAIPILAGLTQMALSLFTTLRQRKTNPAQQQGMAMMIVMSLGMPIMSAVFALQFPVGIGMYWIVGTVFAFVQTLVLGWTHPPQKMLAKSMVDETIERRSRENSRKKVAEIN